MKVLRFEGTTVRETEVENTLEALQEAVFGYIECVTIVPGRAVMIVNEEGLLRGMAANPAASAFAGIQIVGPAIVCGLNGEEFCDVPPEIVRQFA